MDNKCSHRPRVPINLKQLPPIDPSSITNFSKSKMSNSSSRVAVGNLLRQINNEGMELVDCDEGIIKNPTSENIAVDQAASIFPNQKNANTAASSAQIDSENEDMKKGRARSTLYEICTANHWKSPVFECCKEEGPCHLRMFTYKVTVETEKPSEEIIEFYGAPHRTKKSAADSAAEGALWYLKHIGCVMKKK